MAPTRSDASQNPSGTPRAQSLPPNVPNSTKTRHRAPLAGKSPFLHPAPQSTRSAGTPRALANDFPRSSCTQMLLSRLPTPPPAHHETSPLGANETHTSTHPASPTTAPDRHADSSPRRESPAR